MKISYKFFIVEKQYGTSPYLILHEYSDSPAGEKFLSSKYCMEDTGIGSSHSSGAYNLFTYLFMPSAKG